jgi:hypothetical protein
MPRKGFAGAAVPTTLGAAILSTDTSFTIASATGWSFTNGGGPFVVVIDRGTAQEEKILCSGIAGTTVTVAAGGRGYDGTTAFGHATAATILHVLDSITIDEANAHTNLTTRDDHTQYLRTDGTRATTGAMTFGGVTTHAAGVDVTGGINQAGNPEVRIGGGDTSAKTAGAGPVISNHFTGSPRMYFQHRGTGNTGDWYWGNGTGAGTNVMLLGATGVLTLPLAASKIGVGMTPTFALDVAGELRVGGTAHNRVIADDYQSYTTGVLTFRQGTQNVDGSAAAPAYAFTNNANMGMYRVSGGVLGWSVPATGWFSWRNSAGVEVVKFTDSGGVQAIADTHQFGRAALGATGPMLRVTTDATAVYLVAQDQAGVINKPMWFQANTWNWQDGTTLRMALNNTGALMVNASSTISPAGSSAAFNVFTTAGTVSSDIQILRPGGAAASVVAWTISQRPTNTDLLFYGYDGTTFKNFLNFDYANYAVATNATLVVGPTGSGGANISMNGGNVGQVRVLFMDASFLYMGQIDAGSSGRDVRMRAQGGDIATFRGGLAAGLDVMYLASFGTAGGMGPGMANLDNAAQVQITTGGGGINRTGLYVYNSPNGGYYGVRIQSNWSNGLGGPLLYIGNGSGQLFSIDNYGRLEWDTNSVPNVTSTTATAGGGQAVPATVVGYLAVNFNGTIRKIPYFAI